MLSSLKIKNLILVDACEVHFKEGFTIISGETGSGKTVFTHAIALALGEKADPSAIRQGEERAVIELTFDIPMHHPLFSFLSEAGIECDQQEPLLIRRELLRLGKSRAFISNEQVTLSLLQKLKEHLIDQVGQHSHASLRESHYQREILDLFGNLLPLRQSYAQTYTQKKQLEQELIELREQNSFKSRELSHLYSQAEIIHTVKLKPNEDVELTQEHSRLANHQSLAEKISRLQQSVEPLLLHIKRIHLSCEALLSDDPQFKEPEELTQQSLIALQETSHFLSVYATRIENDPYRFDYLEKRLAEIHTLCQKLGCTPSDVPQIEAVLQEKIAHLETTSQKIAELEERLKIVSAELISRGKELSEKRHFYAMILQGELTSFLRRLNMNECELTIQMTPFAPTLYGEDQISFWLQANKGESPSLVKENSSGGELSRLMLAIKRTLAEKNNTPTLIFDEIDSNVGGETATLIGEELRSLGKWKQIFCITHFPQVAACGDQHISVKKIEHEGRTRTTLEWLDHSTKEKELLRMLGGKNYVAPT